MTSKIDKEKLFEYCRIPIDEIATHPLAKVKVIIFDTPDEVHRWTARDMVDEVKRNNAQKRPTRWILPCGPTGQYPYFLQYIHEERVSLKNVYVFHMDDMLDWQGRHLPIEHPFCYEGWMEKNFYGQMDSVLGVPKKQRHFPSIYDIEGMSKEIDAVGGIECTYGGVGYRGHIAFNEPPRSPWYSISIDEFRESQTRILHLNDDTLIALSQRAAGGCSHIIPPMCITLGMRDLLAAKRLRFLSDTGAWKRTVLRYFIFGEPTVEYPVTLAQDHPDVMLVVDRNSILPPLKES
jgi:glucosamine-6-phosphate deaminase